MRPSWDSYFAQLAKLVSSRSTCLRVHHGAVIVKDNRILATGYNGSPPATYHCEAVGTCYREAKNIPHGQRYELCRAVHAEQNALLQAAKYGIPISGASIYITDVPCEICAKLLHCAGIKEIIIIEDSGLYSSNALHDFQLQGFSVRTLKLEEGS